MDDRSFDCLRELAFIETRSDHFLKAMKAGKVSSNLYLRRIHNFALLMDWLLKSLIPKASCPQIIFKAKRAITREEAAGVPRSRSPGIRRRHSKPA